MRLPREELGPTPPLRHADWLSRVCTTTPANILRYTVCIVRHILNIKYINIIEDVNNSWWSTITPQHSQTNKDGCRKEKARVPIETRFLPSADSISDKSRASHLSHLITSLHAGLPEVARHACMPACRTPHRSVNLHKVSSYACMHVFTFCHNAS